MRSAKIVILGAVSALLIAGCSGASSDGSADTQASATTSSATTTASDTAAQDADTDEASSTAGVAASDTDAADDASPETSDTVEEDRSTLQFDTSGITGWTGDELCAALMAADPATMRGGPVTESKVHELSPSAVRCEAGDGGYADVVLYVKWPNGSSEPESNDAAQIYSNAVGSQCRTALPLGQQACYVNGFPASVNMTVGGIYAGLTVNPDDAAHQQSMVDGFVKILDTLGIPH